MFHKIKGNCEFPADFGVSGDVLSHLGKLDYAGQLSFHESQMYEFSCFTLSKLRRIIGADQGFTPSEPLAPRLVCPLCLTICLNCSMNRGGESRGPWQDQSEAIFALEDIF